MLKNVEKYEIVDEIGHGGMATVYRARDTRLDRLIALKVMHPHLQGAREARQRFAREAVTVARLHHPSILEIYDYSGEGSEVSFIATELLTGPTLKKFAEEHPSIPPEIAACIALQVARALGAAHQEGVIHRDVKPENVMLHENRSVKLTDFGIAQLVDVQSMTTTGQVLGSPGHMAPEQIEGKGCDARTDLFSLGTVLYMLATGELPFTGTNPHQVLKRIMDGRFQDPQQVRPAIGGKLARIIVRLLEVEPERRYDSAADLDRDLLDFIGDVGIDAPDQALADYLKAPESFGSMLRAQTIEKLSAIGEEAQQRGDMPTALDCYNRVLAIDESNARVLSAVQGLGRRSAMRQSLVRGIGAVMVLGAALGAYAMVRAPRASAPIVGDTKRAQPTAPSDVKREPRMSVDVSPKKPPVVATTKPPQEPKHDRKPRVPKPPVTPMPEPGAPRRISFNPSPANVSIGVNGGDPRPFGPSFHDIELVPGTHRFKFVGAHDCCIDEEITLEVPPGIEDFTISKKLKFRPAGLYVVTETPANVTVDGGRVSGRSRSVIEVADMDDLTEMHRIRVSAEGHADFEQAVKLRAGQVVTVEVSLDKTGQGT